MHVHHSSVSFFLRAEWASPQTHWSRWFRSSSCQIERWTIAVSWLPRWCPACWTCWSEAWGIASLSCSHSHTPLPWSVSSEPLCSDAATPLSHGLCLLLLCVVIQSQPHSSLCLFSTPLCMTQPHPSLCLFSTFWRMTQPCPSLCLFSPFLRMTQPCPSLCLFSAPLCMTRPRPSVSLLLLCAVIQSLPHPSPLGCVSSASLCSDSVMVTPCSCFCLFSCFVQSQHHPLLGCVSHACEQWNAGVCLLVVTEGNSKKKKLSRYSGSISRIFSGADWQTVKPFTVFI